MKNLKIPDEDSVASSNASSFVPVARMKNLKIPDDSADTANSYDNDDGSWSHVKASDSTIGFDETSVGTPAPSLPHSATDEELARQLHLQEEDKVFQRLVEQEKKRNSLWQQPVSVRGRILADDILSFVRSCQYTSEPGFCSPKESTLEVLCCEFIKYVDENPKAAASLEICYHFSYKLGLRTDQIFKHGFGNAQQFSSNSDVALSKCRSSGTGLPSRIMSRYVRTAPMHQIPENLAVQQKDSEEHAVGWLVAAVDGIHDTKRLVRAPSGMAIVKTRELNYQSIPLICFDASRRNDDVVRRLLNGLSRVFHDFIRESALLEHEVHPHKKHKSSAASEATESVHIIPDISDLPTAE